MADDRATTRYEVRMAYRPDRLLPEKLAQAYQLLVPDRVAPATRSLTEKKDEASRDLCPCIVGAAEGTGNDRQPDSGVAGVCSGAELDGAPRVAVSGRRL